jgi:hypothetical protein
VSPESATTAARSRSRARGCSCSRNKQHLTSSRWLARTPPCRL